MTISEFLPKPVRIPRIGKRMRDGITDRSSSGTTHGELSGSVKKQARPNSQTGSCDTRKSTIWVQVNDGENSLKGNRRVF